MKNIIIKFLNVFLVLLLTVYGQINVSYVGGEAYVIRSNKGEYLVRSSSSQKITHGMEIKPGDVIKTGNRSFVALRFDDGSVHKISANTEYEIKTYDNSGSSRFQIFSIIKGKVFSFVSKTFKKSDIKFLTPTAVVGVRGTTLSTEVTNSGTTVYLLEGHVQLGDLGGKNTVSLKQGEKGEVSVSSDVNKQTMKKSDFEKSVEGIPVSLGKVSVGAEADTAKIQEQQDKDLVKSEVRSATERIDRQRQAVLENKTWDYQSAKTIGSLRVTQSVTKPAANEIKLVTHTFDINNSQQSSLNLGITFAGPIPGIDAVRNKAKAEVENINWNIAVSKGGSSDNLFYSKNYKNDAEVAAFNGKNGDSLEVTGVNKIGGTFNLPGSIAFKIDGSQYKFNFGYNYIDSSLQGYPIEMDSSDERYNYVINGDWDTNIKVSATELGDAKVWDKGNEFDIIILNGFLFPLFNSISS